MVGVDSRWSKTALNERPCRRMTARCEDKRFYESELVGHVQHAYASASAYTKKKLRQILHHYCYTCNIFWCCCCCCCWATIYTHSRHSPVSLLHDIRAARFICTVVDNANPQCRRYRTRRQTFHNLSFKYGVVLNTSSTFCYVRQHMLIMVACLIQNFNMQMYYLYVSERATPCTDLSFEQHPNYHNNFPFIPAGMTITTGCAPPHRLFLKWKTCYS